MTVDEYIRILPNDQQKALQNLRKVIKKVAPEAEELISYAIPSYKYHGLLVHFAAFSSKGRSVSGGKNHLSFFPGSKKVTAEFAPKLKDFYVKNATIHFTPEKPLPDTLVTQIVKARMKENELRGNYG